jgi:large subunit ribosomal protein L19
MQSVSQKIQARYMKPAIVAVKSGDTVRVHQKIVEGGKERVQIFEGLVIRVGRRASLTQTFTVRRIASGIGVEKTYLIHSPNVLKIEVTKRSKVRRNYLSYMRALTGKSARLSSVDFDRQKVNAANTAVAEEEALITGQSQDAPTGEADEAQVTAPTEAAEETEADKLEDQPTLRPSAENPKQEQNKE